MINTKFFLQASACVLLSGNTQAFEVKNLTFDYFGSPLVNISHTTHIHTPMELKPISSIDNAIRFAAVRSIVDTGENSFGTPFSSSDINTNLDSSEQCSSEGFSLTQCPENSFPDETTRCPHDSSYFSACSCDTTYYTVPESNRLSTCGNLANTEACSDKSGTYYACQCTDASLTSCSAQNEYISEQDYRSNIVEGYNYCRSNLDLTSYSYPQSICKSCNYPYVVNASKNGCSCSPEFIECDLGYEAGAQSCVENGVTKYNKCKSCPNVGTYTSCPTGYTCSFEKCSSKYYITGCATGNVNMDNCTWYKCWIKPLTK